MSCFEGELCGNTQEYSSEVWQLKLGLTKLRLIDKTTEILRDTHPGVYARVVGGLCPEAGVWDWDKDKR